MYWAYVKNGLPHLAYFGMIRSETSSPSLGREWSVEDWGKDSADSKYFLPLPISPSNKKILRMNLKKSGGRRIRLIFKKTRGCHLYKHGSVEKPIKKINSFIPNFSYSACNYFLLILFWGISRSPRRVFSPQVPVFQSTERNGEFLIHHSLILPCNNIHEMIPHPDVMFCSDEFLLVIGN